MERSRSDHKPMRPAEPTAADAASSLVPVPEDIWRDDADPTNRVKVGHVATIADALADRPEQPKLGEKQRKFLLSAMLLEPHEKEAPNDLLRRIADHAETTVENFLLWLTPNSGKYNSAFADAWWNLGETNKIKFRPIIIDKLAKLAAQGIPWAQRLLLEATGDVGSRQPLVNVQAQGEVEVHFNIPRPSRPEG